MSIAITYKIKAGSNNLTLTMPQLYSLYNRLDNVMANARDKGFPQMVVSLSARFFGTTVSEMLSANRTQTLCEQRWMVMSLLRRWPLTLHQIGRLMPKRGKSRDHGTIGHGLHQHDVAMETRADYKKQFEALKAFVESNIGSAL